MTSFFGQVSRHELQYFIITLVLVLYTNLEKPLERSLNLKIVENI